MGQDSRIERTEHSVSRCNDRVAAEPENLSRATWSRNTRRVWLVIHRGLDSATCQPQAIAHGLHEAESVAVAEHAIARVPLASENENH